jgi:hypothetical protein
MRLSRRLVTRVLAAQSAVASGVLALISCTSTSSPLGGQGFDASSPSSSTVDAAPGLGKPFIAPSDARPDVALAMAGCAELEPLACDFNYREGGTSCPPYSAFISGGGFPNLSSDGGVDGSGAIRVDVPTGGGGYYGMPFQPYDVFPLPSIAHCRVTCEANLRIAEGASLPMQVVQGDYNDGMPTFTIGVRNGVWTQESHPDAATVIAQGAIATGDWVHVIVRLSPRDGGGAISEATLITADDASTTTTLPISSMGGNMRFGAGIPWGAGPAQVFIDDVICHVTE